MSVPQALRCAMTSWFVLFLCFVTVLPAGAGQKELMEAWTTKKQAVTDQVYETLRKQGKLPQNGTVVFRARVARDPAHPETMRIQVDEVRVQGAVPQEADFAPVGLSKTPHAAAQEDADAAARKKIPAPVIREMPLDWEPLDVSGLIVYEELDIPVGQELSGEFEIREGVPAPEKRSVEPWIVHGGDSKE